MKCITDLRHYALDCITRHTVSSGFNDLCNVYTIAKVSYIYDKYIYPICPGEIGIHHFTNSPWLFRLTVQSRPVTMHIGIGISTFLVSSDLHVAQIISNRCAAAAVGLTHDRKHVEFPPNLSIGFLPLGPVVPDRMQTIANIDGFATGDNVIVMSLPLVFLSAAGVRHIVSGKRNPPCRLRLIITALFIVIVTCFP